MTSTFTDDDLKQLRPALPYAGPATGIAPAPPPELPKVAPKQGMVPPSTAGAPSAAPSSPARQTGNELQPARPATDNEKRLTDLETMPYGAKTVTNPALRALATVGNIASGLVPRIAPLIPGTDARHGLELARAQRAVTNDQNQQAAQDTSRLRNAQATEAESLPELHQTQAELAAEKLHSAEAAKDADRAIKEAEEKRKSEQGQQTLDQHLADSGFKRAPDGSIGPLPYEEMSEPQKAVHDLKASQQELADARTALVKAQKDNIPAAAELARQRIENAQRNSAIAAGRLGLSRDEFEANYFGTHGGEPLPGAPADTNGNPIGIRTAGVTKPPAATQTKAAQAKVIKEAGDKLIKEIDAKSSKIGNLESYWNQAINGTPISDPDAAGLMTSLESFAALQPGLHGFRSRDAMREFAKIIGGIPKNPESLKAAIHSIENTAGIVESGGTMRTVQPQMPGGRGGQQQNTPKIGDIKVFPNGRKGKFDGVGWVAQP